MVRIYGKSLQFICVLIRRNDMHASLVIWPLSLCDYSPCALTIYYILCEKQSREGTCAEVLLRAIELRKAKAVSKEWNERCPFFGSGFLWSCNDKTSVFSCSILFVVYIDIPGIGAVVLFENNRQDIEKTQTQQNIWVARANPNTQNTYAVIS